jgi:two-component system alkaline phosphatase synthesis response regulator PhoP
VSKKAKILVADDEKSILKMVEARLKSNHYDVVTAEDGVQALEKIKASNPDLIILDLAMPQKNGLQVCKDLKRDPQYAAFKNIPIIILSAWVRDKVGEEKALADAYVSKPFEPESLLNEIRYLLENHGNIKRPAIS